MDENKFEDLKQFIAATVSQTEQRLTDRIVGIENRVGGLENKAENLERQLASVEQKLDDGFAGVGDAVETIQEHSEKHDVEVDLRLTKLEQRVA